MKTNLMTLKNVAAVKHEYKVLGHTMVYGNYLLASNRVWNDKQGAYEHYAAIFTILSQDQITKTTPVILTAQADDTFPDQGHAFAWAIAMIEAL